MPALSRRRLSRHLLAQYRGYSRTASGFPISADLWHKLQAAAEAAQDFLVTPSASNGLVVSKPAARSWPNLIQHLQTRTSTHLGTAASSFNAVWQNVSASHRRAFHNYFVTHLPSSSLHPDSRSSAGPGHQLPRDASTPHTPGPGSAPAVAALNMPNRDLTVVRIPLLRAKHHYGVASARGTRPYNEDTNQAGTIAMPAFAKRAPVSLQRKPIQQSNEATAADSALGDPQIFYFGVFDGHGGNECSEFLRDELHGYIEEASSDFGLQSSLRRTQEPRIGLGQKDEEANDANEPDMKSEDEVREQMNVPTQSNEGQIKEPEKAEAMKGVDPIAARVDSVQKARQLEQGLIDDYKRTIGGYFRRFHPQHFNATSRKGHSHQHDPLVTVESVLMYAFLRADLDFVSAQARKPDPDDPRLGDSPVNDDEVLGKPHAPPSGHGIGGTTRFKGGSTASERRLRRYAPANSLVSGDSFGEQRITGLANSRAFGDMRSKRIGVSAEPEITRVDLGPAQYSFLTLVSDGVSGHLSDQEIVDVVKEARTPEQGAQKVVDYATEVSANGDNATCLVVRLGGWERRSEGGLGSMGTKEIRDVRRAEALDPRRGKR
ncbi:hypothetical protein VdG2_08334 [Verticillium dahliae VDG2]|nr:hypothetical protein VdG2_08334 [Verticillium dahliae VDG2]